ncbi:hypothetical protein VL04_03525 [Chromobacterium violaceum]|nr:hypothetical protein VK93_11970 [Chromobacterium violaceum]KMN85190.1 hypothetical protein VL02_16365 [Chromobacterium violaceum]KMN91760.1 hypothetical protein VL04_03525 [Chromobacterium violaceum]KMO02880.1 hypothetical protein VL16_15780 [Chromobacterium violaceum]
MRRAKTAILSRLPGESLADVIASDREAFSGIRLLFASDVAGVPLQSMGKSNNPNVPVASLFAGKGFLAFSDGIEQQMNQGSSPMIFACLSLLDTNFLSELPRFFRGEETDQREKIGDTLQFIDAQFGRGFDWTFASLENMREAMKPNNPWPYQKVAAAKLFDSLKNFPQVREMTSEGQSLPLEDYIPAAEEMWETFLTNREAWAAITRRDIIYCIMLRAMLECWSGRGMDDGVRCLVDFCLDQFGFMPMKELYFGWKALRGFADTTSVLSIFDEPALRNPNGNSKNRISALAWDLFMFRWCETLMTEKKGNHFLIPVATTLDEGLLAAIQSCPLRALLIHDEAQIVEAIFDDEMDFAECLDRALSDKTKARIQDPVRLAKRKDVSRHDLSLCIYTLESEVDAARKAR